MKYLVRVTMIFGVFLCCIFSVCAGSDCMDNFELLVEKISKTGVQYKIIEHGEITNVEEGLKMLSCNPIQVIKTLGYKIDSKYVFLAVRGDKRIDFKKIASLLKTTRSKIVSIPKDELENDLHYEVGGLSPLCENPLVTIYFDRNILDIDTVFCGIGLKTRTLEINSQDLLNISGAVLSDIVQ